MLEFILTLANGKERSVFINPNFILRVLPGSIGKTAIEVTTNPCYTLVDASVAEVKALINEARPDIKFYKVPDSTGVIIAND